MKSVEVYINSLICMYVVCTCGVRAYDSTPGCPSYTITLQYVQVNGRLVTRVEI